MSQKTFSWKVQLEYGLKAEKDFMEIYHQPIVAATTFSYDFKRVKDGKKLELKTDDWDHEETPNFFFERWSKWEEEKPGGPWQSRSKRVDVFIYYFANNGIYYEFPSIKILCKVLEQIVRKKKLRLVLVKNKGYYTAGYVIKREWLADLYEVYEVPKD